MDLKTMIGLLQNDLANEMGHMMFYLQNSATLIGLHRQEIRELFLDEAASEMKHVQQFQDLIIGLGGHISVIPKGMPVFDDPKTAVKYAYDMETEVVANYVERLEQAQQLGGVNGRVIEIFLEEQILQSRTDADNLRMLHS
jgi:bacterioferritin (cytochrome b1)